MRSQRERDRWNFERKEKRKPDFGAQSKDSREESSSDSRNEQETKEKFRDRDAYPPKRQFGHLFEEGHEDENLS